VHVDFGSGTSFGSGSKYKLDFKSKKIKKKLGAKFLPINVGSNSKKGKSLYKIFFSKAELNMVLIQFPVFIYHGSGTGSGTGSKTFPKSVPKPP
jgi:hypothetical protein